MYDPARAVGGIDAVFDLEHGTARDDLPEGAGDGAAIVTLDQREELLVVRRIGVERETEDPLHLLGPLDLIGGGVPHPGADVGDLLRLRQGLQRPSARGLGLMLRGDVDELRDEIQRVAVSSACQRHRLVEPERSAAALEVALPDLVGGALAGEQFDDLLLVDQRVLRVNQRLEVRAHELGLAATADFAQLAVDADQRSGERGERHADRRLGEDAVHVLIGVADRSGGGGLDKAPARLPILAEDVLDGADDLVRLLDRREVGSAAPKHLGDIRAPWIVADHDHGPLARLDDH